MILFLKTAKAQTNTFPTTGSAGIGTTTPNAYSILEMISTTKGLLVPRMNKNQRDAIAVTPPTGLLIYQTNNTPGFYYYDGGAWTAVTPKAKGWSLTGNTGTSPATNFIGTTDAQPMVFKVNNQKAGYLDYINANTSLGYQALNSSTGYANTATGYQSLLSNTTGNNNTATGIFALHYNSIGVYNTATGSNALGNNTNGTNNTANGYRALVTNTTGYYNTATGAYALENNIDGIGNTANGISALRSNTNGSNNTAAGANTLFYNTIGYSNVAIGSNALFNNITGHNLVAIGDSALYNQNGGDDYYPNTAVGSKALYSNLTGSDNTASGSKALYNNLNGNDNTASGYYALGTNFDGNVNTAFGVAALNFNTNGAGNTAIGYNANANNGNYNSSSAFGISSLITASDQVRIGNTSTASIGGYQSWTTLPSDKRVKKNIKENVPGLAFINKLKPVTYTIDISAIDKIIQRPVIKDKDGKLIQPSQQELDSRKVKEQIVFTGFLAQDVEAAATSLNYDFSGVDKPKNDKDLYGIRYSDFVMPLVKAVQELSKQNDSLNLKMSQFDNLKIENEELKSRLNLIEQKLGITTQIKNSSTIMLSTASLQQNIPNPFSNTTTINYSLPQKYSSAKIIVIDELGNTIKIFNLSGTGKGTINFSSPFRVGASYQYSLLVDGKLIDTKQMVLAK